MPLLARLLLVSAFLVSGVLKLLDFKGAVEETRGLRGAALLLGGGRQARLGAVLLGGFTLAATLLARAFWTRNGAARISDASTFFEHLGLIGGLALAGVAGRSGDGG